MDLSEDPSETPKSYKNDDNNRSLSTKPPNEEFGNKITFQEISINDKATKIPRTTYGSYTIDLSLCVNTVYHTQLTNENESKDCIKEGCADLIASAIEKVSSTLCNRAGIYVKLVWAPWHDNSDIEAIPYTEPNPLQQRTAKLPWHEAKELLNNAYFNQRTLTRRNINIRLLFNGTPEDQSTIRTELQKEMRVQFENTQ
eukprot:12285679-Ditylum_brightwellii.AAC.1